MHKNGYTYILTNKSNLVLYIGVTTNLAKRIHEHKNHVIGGFTQKYNVTKLVYFESHSSIEEAIKREKQLKAGSRKKKLQLIDSQNPTFDDLYYKLSF